MQPAMKRSTDRILTTHVGSLARPAALLDTMRERENGRPYDSELLDRQVREAVADVVRRQAAAGLDVVTDGEQSKVSFATYVKDRLAGFSATEGETLTPPSWQVEIDAFPDYYRGYLSKYSSTVTPMRVMVCTGPISYTGHDLLRLDIANLRAALAGLDPGLKPVEAFLPSASPSGFGRNEYYGSHADYLSAVAEAMREEYRGILDAGFLLQVDDPWLIELLADPAHDPATRRRNAELHVEILNHALRGLPTERIRLHTCYGLNHGPRLSDLPMRDVAPLMLKIDAGAYSFEVANPRHQHEWRILGGHRAAGRQDPDPWPARARHQLRRAPGADRRLPGDLREPGRPGERARRGGLRLLLARDLLTGGAPDGRVGEVHGVVRGGGAGDEATVVLTTA